MQMSLFFPQHYIHYILTNTHKYTYTHAYNHHINKNQAKNVLYFNQKQKQEKQFDEAAWIQL